MPAPLSRTIIAISLALASLGLAGKVRATIYCDIKPTRDGFVALRSGPSPTARLIAKMRPGDEVQVGIERKGRFIEVTYWRGGRFASGRDGIVDPSTAVGWMHEDLVAPDSCG
jgi:hypothetical protein